MVPILLFGSISPDTDQYRKLFEYEALSENTVTPLGFGGKSNELYVTAYHNGRLALFLVDLNGDLKNKTLVYSSDEYDFDGGLIYSDKHGDVVG